MASPVLPVLSLALLKFLVAADTGNGMVPNVASSCLLQSRKRIHKADPLETCADLTNQGTHFSVELQVGTPPQRFDVVADTGSDSVIIPSCICAQMSRCSGDDRCFTGTNSSSTFLIRTKEDGSPERALQLEFGSGAIQAAVATDVVGVDHLWTNMSDGLLLMTNQQLTISGPFEGILGLGVPRNRSAFEMAKSQQEDSAPEGDAEANIKKDLVRRLRKALGLPPRHSTANRHSGDSEEKTPAPSPNYLADIADGPLMPGTDEAAAFTSPVPPIQDAMETQGGAPVEDESELKPWGSGKSDVKQHVNSQTETETQNLGREARREQSDLFLERAGVKRFSMCFNDQGSKGALRMGTAPVPGALGSVGTYHWGLGLHGVSVGANATSSAQAVICQDGNLSEGQKTPCGAIPDSGTTAIMGPQDQLETLFAELCDEWPRCRQNHTAMEEAAKAAEQAATQSYGSNPFEMQVLSKADVWKLLLLDCGSWLSESDGLNELPPITFHMVGAGGEQKAVKLSGWAYVIETMKKDYIYKHLKGVGDVPVGYDESSPGHKVCAPSFGKLDYNTQANGPVWIIGTPLFYQFQVAYDMEATPPSIAFTSVEESPCTTCSQQASLVVSETGRTAPAGIRVARQPRQLKAELRVSPGIDTSRPL